MCVRGVKKVSWCNICTSYYLSALCMMRSPCASVCLLADMSWCLMELMCVCVCVQRPEVGWGTRPTGSCDAVSQQEVSCWSSSTSVCSEPDSPQTAQTHRGLIILYSYKTGFSLWGLTSCKTLMNSTDTDAQLNILCRLYCSHLVEKYMEVDKEAHSALCPLHWFQFFKKVLPLVVLKGSMRI